MKKIQKSTLLLVIMLLINTITYAQIDIDPADLGGEEMVDPLDETSSPIDENLWIIIVFGLVYTFIVIKMRYEKKIHNNYKLKYFIKKQLT